MKAKGSAKRATRNMFNAFCERKPAAFNLSTVPWSTSASRRFSRSTMLRILLLSNWRSDARALDDSELRRARSRPRICSRSDVTAFMRLSSPPDSK
jgi:hypothetical protein